MANTSQGGERLDFQYSPLTQSDSIRLIELQPSRDKAATINCELIHTTLRRAQRDIIDHYTALSYVWGDQSNLTTVWVGQKRLRVTRNLECALIHLRDKTRVLCIWADAICINQNDNAERTFQVGLMGKIYATAHHTVIFLGPCDANVETVLKTIWEDWENDQSSDVQGSNVALSISDQYHQELLDRPWFYRVWIFQELVLSTDPRIQVGSIRCTWDKFYEFATKSAARSSVRNESGIEAVTTMQSARRHQKDPVSKFIYGKNDPPSFSAQAQKEAMQKLLEFIVSRRGYGVSDPRDMIFAHLGLVPDTGLKINYQLAAPQVFEEFFRHYVKVCKNLSMIGFVEDVSLHGTDISSWAPNWAHQYRQLTPLSHQYTGSSPLRYCPFHGPYEILPKGFDTWYVVRHQMPSFVKSPSIMYGLGFFDSRISEVSEVMKDPGVSNLRPSSENPILPWLNEQLALWHEQLGPRQQEWFHPSKMDGDFFNINRGTNINWENILTDVGVPTTQGGVSGPMWGILGLLVLRLGCGLESNIRMVDGRRVATIHENPNRHHLALVPASSRRGDYICGFQGSETLLVVRECRDDTGADLENEMRSKTSAKTGTASSGNFGIKHVRLIGECMADHMFKSCSNRLEKVLDDQVYIIAIH